MSFKKDLEYLNIALSLIQTLESQIGQIIDTIITQIHNLKYQIALDSPFTASHMTSFQSMIAVQVAHNQRKSCLILKWDLRDHKSANRCNVFLVAPSISQNILE